MKNLSLLIISLLFITSCNTSGEITSAHAEGLVEEYLALNPHYETAYFDTNKMRLSSKKDAELIETIRDLEDQGLIEIVDENSRKKWFSKDSVFVITPNLTKEALPYVVKQAKNRTEVKTVEYELDDSRDILFTRKTDKSVSFNAILLKKKTPFYSFGKDKNPNSEFITKEFKAKYVEEKGWILVR